MNFSIEAAKHWAQRIHDIGKWQKKEHNEHTLTWLHHIWDLKPRYKWTYYKTLLPTFKNRIDFLRSNHNFCCCKLCVKLIFFYGSLLHGIRSIYCRNFINSINANKYASIVVVYAKLVFSVRTSSFYVSYNRELSER